MQLYSFGPAVNMSHSQHENPKVRSVTQQHYKIVTLRVKVARGKLAILSFQQVTTLSFHFTCLLTPSLSMALFQVDFSMEANTHGKNYLLCLLPFACLSHINFSSQKFSDDIKHVSMVREDVTKSNGMKLSQSKCWLNSRRSVTEGCQRKVQFPKRSDGKAIT